MNKLAGIVSMLGGLVAIIINSQILAIVMLTNGIITGIWYLRDGN